jgi:hypothetical protein
VEYAEEEKGRCRSCGFLSKHSTYRKSPAPRFYEIEQYERQTESHELLFRYPVDVAARVLEVYVEVVCFVQAADLNEPLREIGPVQEGNWPERVRIAKEIINFDRHCPAWYPYDPGFSPREHYEVYQMQRLESDRRAFETRLFEMGQKAQENSLKVAEDSRRIVHDLKEIARSNDDFVRSNERSTKRVTILVIVLAVIQTIGTVLALTGIGWMPRLWHHFFG